MTASIFMLVLGMALVTYIPRMLPFVLFKEMKLSPFWEGVLKNIPFATLGALIFPGVLFIQENIWMGLIGGVSAVILSLFGANVMLVVVGSIGILTVLSIFL
jgi:branched-subunit amino acid transport protein